MLGFWRDASGSREGTSGSRRSQLASNKSCMHLIERPRNEGHGRELGMRVHAGCMEVVLFYRQNGLTAEDEADKRAHIPAPKSTIAWTSWFVCMLTSVLRSC
jgi:hypothetical protein